MQLSFNMIYIDFIHRLTWTFRIGGGKNFEEEFNLQGTNLQGPIFFSNDEVERLEEAVLS